MEEKNNLSNTWISILKFAILPICIISNFLAFFEYCIQTWRLTNFEYTLTATRYAILSLVFIIYTIIILILLFKNYKKIPEMIIYYFLILGIYSSLNYACNYAKTEIEVVIYFLIFLILLIFCWIIPNYTYFNKRKNNFNNNLTKDTKQNIDKLKEIANMYNEKLITEKEYQKLKEDILKNI